MLQTGPLNFPNLPKFSFSPHLHIVPSFLGTTAGFHGCGEKNLAQVIFFFPVLLLWVLLLFEKGTFNFTLRKRIVWHTVVFVPSGVENNTPSQHREILLPEILRCHVALHPFCINVKPWVFYCARCRQYCALTIGAMTEFVATCCHRAFIHSKMCSARVCVHL